jgi:hypothetical protein
MGEHGKFVPLGTYEFLKNYKDGFSSVNIKFALEDGMKYLYLHLDLSVSSQETSLLVFALLDKNFPRERGIRNKLFSEVAGLVLGDKAVMQASKDLCGYIANIGKAVGTDGTQAQAEMIGQKINELKSALMVAASDAALKLPLPKSTTNKSFDEVEHIAMILLAAQHTGMTEAHFYWRMGCKKLDDLKAATSPIQRKPAR